jgi:hypothetical protein
MWWSAMFVVFWLLWLLGISVNWFGGFVHLLFIVAILALIVQFASGRQRV